MQRRIRTEEGFTIIELMIAMAIMLLITVPLVTSFVLGIVTSRDGLQDVTNSADAQVLAQWFDTDVANAEEVRKNVTSTCAGGTAVLELRWTDGGTQHVVAYRLAAADIDVQRNVTAASPGVTVQQLERVACPAGTAGLVAVARSVVVETGSPDVTCDGKSTCPLNPRAVTLKLREFSALVVDKGSNADRYTIGLTASRKVTT